MWRNFAQKAKIGARTIFGRTNKEKVVAGVDTIANLMKDKGKSMIFHMLKAQNGFGRAKMAKDIQLLNEFVDMMKQGNITSLDIILSLAMDGQVAKTLILETPVVEVLLDRVKTSQNVHERLHLSYLMNILTCRQPQLMLPNLKHMFTLLEESDTKIALEVVKTLDNLFTSHLDLVKSNPEVVKDILSIFPKLPQGVITDLRTALESNVNDYTGREASRQTFLFINNIGVTAASGFLWTFTRYLVQSMRLRMLKLPVGKIILSSGKATVLLLGFEILRQFKEKYTRELIRNGQSWESEALNVVHTALVFPPMLWSLQHVSFILAPYLFAPTAHQWFKKSMEYQMITQGSGEKK